MEEKGKEGLHFKNPNPPSSKGSSSSEAQRPKWTEGPHGFGDPEDKRLRKVEREVMIPIKMREKAKAEKCSEEVKAFTECCKQTSIAMVVTCRPQNFALKACLTNWYNDAEFREICTQEYLAERTEYRATGIKKKAKKYEA